MHDKQACWCLVKKTPDDVSTTHCLRHGKSIMSIQLFDRISDRITDRDNTIIELKGEINSMKNRKDLSKGIATAGIWLGVGISAFGCGMFSVFIAGFAWFATEKIWER